MTAKFPYTCPVEAEPLYRYKPGGYHPVHIGDVVGGGRYKILHKLGFGAYSTVWAARDQHLSRNVAVKINISEFDSAARELRILKCLATSLDARAKSRGIVRFYDDFQLTGPNGAHQCIVTELLGPSVYDYLDQRTGHRLPATWAHHIATQLLRAIDYLHQRSIGHGDAHIKNIVFKGASWEKLSEAELMLLLGKPHVGRVDGVDGSSGMANMPTYLVWPSSLPFSLSPFELPEVRLVDFGQAFAVDDKPRTLTTHLPLRAPEIIFGDDWDHCADLWTVGCTIFELFTGQPPFDTIMTTKDILIGQMIEEIGSLPERWAAKWEGVQDSDDEQYSLEEWLNELYFGEAVTQLSCDQINSLAKALRMLMRLEPAQRKSAAYVLDHSWFSAETSL